MILYPDGNRRTCLDYTKCRKMRDTATERSFDLQIISHIHYGEISLHVLYFSPVTVNPSGIHKVVTVEQEDPEAVQKLNTAFFSPVFSSLPISKL